jgi:hypothetical protein
MNINLDGINLKVKYTAHADTIESVIKNCFLTNKFYDMYAKNINWSLVIKNQKLNEEQIEKYNKYFSKYSFYILPQYQKLSEKLIRKLESKLNWNPLSIYQIMSDDFIEEFKDKITFDRPNISSNLLHKLKMDYNQKFQNNLILLEENNISPTWNDILEMLDLKDDNQFISDIAENYFWYSLYSHIKK